MKIAVQTGNVPHGTIINSIVVPEKMRIRIPTGIEFLDDCYGGQGLTPGTITLFTGTPGAGKSTLSLQIAQAVAGRPDCFALFNTSEESVFQTKLVAERLFGPTGGLFYVGEDSLVDDQHANFHEKNRALVANKKATCILQHSRSLQVKHPDKQQFLIIDSLQTIDDGMYADGHRNGNTPVRAMELLTNFAKATYTIVIVIGQVNKGGEFAGKQAVKHIVDCHMHLKIDTRDKSETQGMRIFEMQKNRFGHSGSAYILNIEESGLREWGALKDEDE